MRAANASASSADAVREQDGELVAAEPGGGLVLAEAGEPLADALQQLVAELVAERVVHLLEVVDVEQQHDRPHVAGGERRVDLGAEERPVRQPRQLVVVGAPLDLVHLAPDPERDAAEDRHERDEEQDQHGLEDPGDRQEGRVRGARDRRVVLVDDDDAGAAANGDRGVGAERLALLDGRDVAADDPLPRLGGVLGRGDARPDQAMVGAVRDGAVGSDERREQDALVEDAVREEAVELGAAGRVRALEVGRLQRLAQDGAREHARLRRRAAFGLDGVEVADDEQDRRRGEREPDPGADREAEDEPRRIARDAGLSERRAGGA